MVRGRQDGHLVSVDTIATEEMLHSGRDLEGVQINERDGHYQTGQTSVGFSLSLHMWTSLRNME